MQNAGYSRLYVGPGEKIHFFSAPTSIFRVHSARGLKGPRSHPANYDLSYALSGFELLNRRRWISIMADAGAVG